MAGTAIEKFIATTRAKKLIWTHTILQTATAYRPICLNEQSCTEAKKKQLIKYNTVCNSVSLNNNKFAWLEWNGTHPRLYHAVIINDGNV